MNVAAYRVESCEADWNSHELGSGYTIPRHGGYHAIPPQDHLHNARTKICLDLEAMGVPSQVPPPRGRRPRPVRDRDPAAAAGAQAADAILLVKYVARMTARQLGHDRDLHAQAAVRRGRARACTSTSSLWKGDTNLFYDAAGYGCLERDGALLHRRRC